MAGVYNTWTDQQTGETKDTFAIVTTEANSLMRQVHNSKNRMPVILPQELAEEWTNHDLTEERIKQIATYQFPAEQMEAYPVAKDFIQCDEPTSKAAYEQLPDLVLS